MARPRSETLGSLGRSPARSGRTPVVASPPPPPPKAPPPEPGAARRWIRGALFDNVPLKFLSMVLAVTVFLLVNTDEEREISVRVDVAYEIPPNKVLTSEPLEEARVTIKGAWRRLRQFDERQLSRIVLDLRAVPAGDVPLTPKLVEDVPPGLTVTAISPPSVRVAFDNVATKSVEVITRTSGRPAHGFVVSEIKPQPTTVSVRGGERVLAALRTVSTVPVDLAGRTEGFDAATAIDAPEGVAVEGAQTVDVKVRIAEELVTRAVPGLAVALRPEAGAPVDVARWRVVPPQIEITLTGTLLAVERAKAAMVPVVRLGPADIKAREAQVSVEGVPPGVGVRLSPERVKLAPVGPRSP